MRSYRGILGACSGGRIGLEIAVQLCLVDNCRVDCRACVPVLPTPGSVCQVIQREQFTLVVLCNKPVLMLASQPIWSTFTSFQALSSLVMDLALLNEMGCVLAESFVNSWLL